MAPDFESFLQLGAAKVWGHTWKGVLLLDLPMAYLLLYLFHGIFKRPFYSHLPAGLQQRLPFTTFLQWHQYHMRHLGIVLVSVLAGILSHLLWDAFTHLNLMYPDAITSRIMVGSRRLYIVLQYACSVIGLWYIIWAVKKLPVQYPVV
ncbi:MAG: DUF4184 family protein, partial [Chitinophagia bacterium]|nr:DUF4184 family protein [Chitinophagia bacterium]